MNNLPSPEQPAPPPRYIRVAVPTVKPGMTYTLLGFTTFVFLLQLLGQRYHFDLITALGLKVGEYIRAWQLWRLVTPVFLHASLVHIFSNMFALYLYGRGIEARYGHARFLLLYFLSAFSGNVFSFLFTPGVSLGASTAIFGLFAAEAIFIFQNRSLFAGRANRLLVSLLFFIAYDLYLGFTTPGVDNWGHLGGLLGGLIFAWFGGPRWRVDGRYPSLHLVDDREGQGALAGTIAVLLFFIPLAAMGWFWPVGSK